MGMTRKFLSMTTVGLVDFRSDKERTAAYTHGMLQQQKKQTKMMRQQQQQQGVQPVMPQPQWGPPRQQLDPPPAPVVQGPPPGWYADQQDQSVVRWFDGQQWTEFVQARQ